MDENKLIKFIIMGYDKEYRFMDLILLI